MYVYQADLWCDSCGERLRGSLTEQGYAPDDPDDEYSYDSDDFPKHFADGGKSDSPNHCASREECLEAIDLREWGLPANAELVGAETVKIGALLDERLTEHGVAYLRETLTAPTPTPYQRALYRLWRQAFADDL